MNVHDILEIVRLVAVMALVCVAAALATPKGRVLLALRGIAKLLRRDVGLSVPDAPHVAVPAGRRLVAFLLVLFAIILALI